MSPVFLTDGTHAQLIAVIWNFFASDWHTRGTRILVRWPNHLELTSYQSLRQ